MNDTVIPSDVEELVFAKSRPDPEKMKAAGFVKKGKTWTLSVPFHDGEFRADLCVEEDGKVKGRVIETELEEEYLPLRVASQTSAFVNTIRSEYYDLLVDLEKKAFHRYHFQSAQMNELESWIAETYGEKAEQPFARKDEGWAFYHQDNRKWYAVVLKTQRCKVTKEGQDETEVEILNLKEPEAEVPKLTCEKGIYPGWHMNHTKWISVLLDGTLSNARIEKLIETSRYLAGMGKGEGAKAYGEWIVPANPKYFDIVHAYDHKSVIEWKQSITCSPGDTVYMYVAKPVGAILYKTEVVETDIPAHYRGMVNIDKLMRLKFLKRYPEELLTMKVLRTFGVGSMQGSKRVPAALKKVLDSLETIE